MYRVIKMSGIKLYNAQTMSAHLFSVFPARRSSCSLCSNHMGLISLRTNIDNCDKELGDIRHYSTNINVEIMNELSKRKKFRKYKKKYAELLEVYKNKTSETKATVKNLKPKELSLFASNPNITLEHLHELRKDKKSSKSQNEPLKTEKSDANNNLSKEQSPSLVKIVPVIPGIVTDKNSSEVQEEVTKFSESESDTVKTSHRSAEILSMNISDSNEITKDNNTSSEFMSEKTAAEILDELEELDEDAHKEICHVEELSSLGGEGCAEDLKSFREISANSEYIPEPNTSLSAVTAVSKPLPSASVPQQKSQRKTKSLKRSTKEAMAKIKYSELEKAGKEMSFNATLLAYLELCESCGFLNRGFATLQYYINRPNYSKNASRVTNVKVFEVLLRGYASKGNVNKVEELWEMMEAAGIKPSLPGFAARLECIGRATTSSCDNREQNLSKILQSMAKEGFSANDIFEKCQFVSDQREVLLKTVRTIHPDFMPEIPAPDICYSCSLLENINEMQEKNKLLTSPAQGITTEEELEKQAKKQLAMELAASVSVRSVEKQNQPTQTILLYREKLEKLKQVWISAIDKGLQRDLTAMTVFHNNLKAYNHLNIYPYLKVLEPHVYRDLIMQEIRKLAEGSETFSPTTGQLYRELGNKVRTRYILQYKKTHGVMHKTQKLYSEYCKWYMDPTLNNRRSGNARQEWQQLVHENQEGPSVNIEEHMWPNTVLTAIGRFLYNIILRDVKIDVNVMRTTTNNYPHMLPSFYTLYRHQRTKQVEEIKPHPVLSRLYRATAQEELVFDVSSVPMLSPPVPWTTPLSGGYLLTKTDIIRLPTQSVQQWERLKEVPLQQLYPAFDSLNQLASIPWKVNTPVLDVVIEVFNNGGSVKLDIPQPPSACAAPEPITQLMNKQERYQAYRQRMLLRRRKAEMYSLWCDALYRLSLAHHFRDRIFWLPHNMDFRGRVYPCPPHLNHLGSDMARSLLCFAKGKPLGQDGLDWLKIHLVNLTGLKKRDNIVDRLKYANQVLPDILDSAENPLSGRMWWGESETPWQTLACCMEIHAALQCEDGPENYVSHFPVHQDGSCNGLQHYAALGRDKAGAASVNLSPADKPQDVYSCVAAIVERERSKDAANGVKVAQILDGYVRRKVIKQTVMTTVYGVTRFGARLQIAKQLKDIDTFPKEYVWSASTYLVGKTFESLREMFTSTKEIQDWFTECARMVAQVCGQNLEYVTPLGLPVVQPYSRHKKFDFVSQHNNGRLEECFSTDKFERPNVMKQKNAFPPNFIHSLDSSHMMLTSLHCEQQGITFVSVHDCFWTHPSTVHIMNQVCREQFVALHSEPILEELSAFMVKKFSYRKSEISGDPNSVANHSKNQLNTILRRLPPKGNFILDDVLDSVYFFS